MHRCIIKRELILSEQKPKTARGKSNSAAKKVAKTPTVEVAKTKPNQGYYAALIAHPENIEEGQHDVEKNTGDLIPNSNTDNTDVGDGNSISQCDSGLDNSNGTDVADPPALVLGIVGAFVVSAKTDAGFYRAGIKFTRLEKTVVLVCDQEEPIDDVEIVGYEQDKIVCVCTEKAYRIHREERLDVEILDLDELTIQ